MSIRSPALYESGDDSGALSGLMPRSLECVDSVARLALADEVVVILCCFVMGYLTLRVFQLPARRCAARALAGVCSGLPTAEPASEKPLGPGAGGAPIEGLAGLPREISAEVARCLPLHDFASASVASDGTRQRFGLCPEAWHLLASDRQLALGGAEAVHATVECKTSESDTLGRQLREAFRRSLFRTDGRRLFHLGGAAPGVGGAGHAEVLREAAHMVRGLMPCDGAETIELTCLAAERALQAHNPESKDAAAAASTFLQVARRRHDLLSPLQADRLEGAYSSALQLQAFMDVAMDVQFDDMETSSERSQASTPSSGSPRLPIVGPSADEQDEHEVQRHCGLDALLEELRLQTEAASKW